MRSLSTGSTANGLSPTKSQNRSNPATGAVLGEWADGGEAEARAAIAAARRAFDTASWSRDRVLRHRALSEMADRFDAHADELGALVTKENGKILAQGRFESTTVGGTLRHNAADALIDTGISAEVAPGQWFSTYAEPVGVVGIIVPWNAPVALLIRSLASALSAGNTVAVKMPGQTALVANLISQIIAEVTSLPRGVVNIFTESGNTGAPYLVAPPMSRSSATRAAPTSGKPRPWSTAFRCSRADPAGTRHRPLHRSAGCFLAFLSDAEQSACVLVEDGPGGARVYLRVVDVIDRADKGVPVFVGEVGSEDEPAGANRVDRAPEGGNVSVPDGVVPHSACGRAG